MTCPTSISRRIVRRNDTSYTTLKRREPVLIDIVAFNVITYVVSLIDQLHLRMGLFYQLCGLTRVDLHMKMSCCLAA